MFHRSIRLPGALILGLMLLLAGSGSSQEIPPGVLPSPLSGQMPQAELLPETAPLPSEPSPWEQALAAMDQDGQATGWVLPYYWFTAVDWEGGVEVGINGSEGNSDTFSLMAGGNLKRKTELYALTADIKYSNASNNRVETQNNAVANFGYEQFLGDTPWTFFVKELLEYDEFKAFDLRIAVNTGLGYQFIKTDSTKLVGRVGAGFSREIGGPDDSWRPEAVFGIDYERQLTKRQKLKFKVDYYPEWTDFNAYRLVTDFGWEVLLDEAHNLNLKLTANDRYDSTPNPGNRPNDLFYGLVLLWKL